MNNIFTSYLRKEDVKKQCDNNKLYKIICSIYEYFYKYLLVFKKKL